MPTSKGQALADEYGIKFFETVSNSMLPQLNFRNCFCSFLFMPKEYVLQSAKTNLNVEEVFFSIARDIKQRLAETDSRTEVAFCFYFSKIANYLCHYPHFGK